MSEPISQQVTVDLAERLLKIRQEAGRAWGPGFVDPEAADIIRELQSRQTSLAEEALADADVDALEPTRAERSD